MFLHIYYLLLFFLTFFVLFDFLMFHVQCNSMSFSCNFQSLCSKIMNILCFPWIICICGRVCNKFSSVLIVGFGNGIASRWHFFVEPNSDLKLSTSPGPKFRLFQDYRNLEILRWSETSTCFSALFVQKPRSGHLYPSLQDAMIVVMEASRSVSSQQVFRKNRSSGARSGIVIFSVGLRQLY